MTEVINEAPIWERLANYMQKGDTIGAEIGVYAISGILFGVAYHKIRPITKFGKPSDIPSHFVRERIKQIGIVSSVQPATGGPLLRVNHRPPLNLLIGSTKTLPVKILGVSINQNGYSWLQSVVVNNTVKFVPLSNSSGDFAVCQVFLDNKSTQLPVLDLATCLTSLGFAQVTEIPRQLADDPQLIEYFAKLQAVQQRAKRHRTGLWSERIPAPIWPIGELQAIATNAVYGLLPIKRRLPELVR